MHIRGTKIYVQGVCLRVTLAMAFIRACLSLYFRTVVRLFSLVKLPLSLSLCRFHLFVLLDFPFPSFLQPRLVSTFKLFFHDRFPFLFVFSTVLLSFCPADSDFSPRLCFYTYTSAYAATFLPSCFFHRSLQPPFTLRFQSSLWALSWKFLNFFFHVVFLDKVWNTCYMHSFLTDCYTLNSALLNTFSYVSLWRHLIPWRPSFYHICCSEMQNSFFFFTRILILKILFMVFFGINRRWNITQIILFYTCKF